jgi:hypothetical protein
MYSSLSSVLPMDTSDLATRGSRSGNTGSSSSHMSGPLKAKESNGLSSGTPSSPSCLFSCEEVRPTYVLQIMCLSKGRSRRQLYPLLVPTPCLAGTASLAPLFAPSHSVYTSRRSTQASSLKRITTDIMYPGRKQTVPNTTCSTAMICRSLPSRQRTWDQTVYITIDLPQPPPNHLYRHDIEQLFYVIVIVTSHLGTIKGKK